MWRLRPLLILLVLARGSIAVRVSAAGAPRADVGRALAGAGPGAIGEAPFLERLALETVRAAANSFSVWLGMRMLLAKSGGLTELLKALANRTSERSPLEQPVRNCTARFDEVAGIDEVVTELREAVAYLRDPSRFHRLGARMPRGVLLEGVPGTGKTMLARAVAGEAGVPFFSASASSFDEKYVGVGAQRVRALFEAARRAAPAIVFIDEIDCVGVARERGGERQVHAQTLNALLTEMDGFEQNVGIVVLAATNQVGTLDRALSRPGRFDRIIHVPPPDVRGRRRLLGRLAERVRLAADVSLDELAAGTTGLTGAELENIVNLAALRAATSGAPSVARDDVEAARDKVLLGVARPTAVVTPEERWTTAVHEAGHALVALLTPGAHALQKVTVVPHSMAGGSAGGLTVMTPPESEHVSVQQLRARLDVCMGGRAAEELFAGSDGVGVGAEADVREARSLAMLMMSRWGLGDALGPGGVGDARQLSGHTQRLLDAEVLATLRAAHARALGLLRRNRRQLRALAEALASAETLTRAEVDEVLEASRRADTTLPTWLRGLQQHVMQQQLPALAPPSAAAGGGN